MNAESVKKIFLANVGKHDDLNDALVATNRELRENIFAETSSDIELTPEKWELVIKLFDAQSRLCYFWNLPREVHAGEIELFKHLGFLFNIWEECLRFMHANYESQEEDFRRKNPKKQLQVFADQIAANTQERALSMAVNGLIHFEETELELMDTTFQTTIRLVIGKENFRKLALSFNKILPLLRNMYMAAAVPPSNKAN